MQETVSLEFEKSDSIFKIHEVDNLQTFWGNSYTKFRSFHE